MQTAGEEQMAKAIQARNLLAERYLHLSGVSAVDIGYTRNDEDASITLTVRVHVKDERTRQNLDAPESVKGVPVQVILSDNQLE